MNKFKVGDRVWWVAPSDFYSNLYGYSGRRMTGTISDFSPRGAKAWIELDESSKRPVSCPFEWQDVRVGLLMELLP